MAVLESPGKVLDFFVSKRVGTLGFMKGRGTRDGIAALHVLYERNLEYRMLR